MSKRRNVGDWVLVPAGAGFGASATPQRAQIQGDGFEEWHGGEDCGDPDCREWATLWNDTEPRRPLYHVNECEMSDDPPEAA